MATTNSNSVAANPATTPAASTGSTSASKGGKNKLDEMMWGSDASLRSGNFGFYGMDKDGVPTAFTVTDRAGSQGKLVLTTSAPVAIENGVQLKVVAMTRADGPNVLLSQTFTITGSGTDYAVQPSVGIKGSWVPLKISNSPYVIERMSNGNYLVTVTILVDSSINAGFSIPVGNLGTDLNGVPKSIVTRLVLDAGKTQVLAQAIAVNGAKGGAN